MSNADLGQLRVAQERGRKNAGTKCGDEYGKMRDGKMRGQHGTYPDSPPSQKKYYFLPSANSPNVSGCTVITSGPVIWPAMIGLLGIVS